MLSKTNNGNNLELEKRLAQALKSETGESFSTLTELIFNNVSESETLVEQFKACTTNLPFLDFSFKVLEQKTWPIDTSNNSEPFEQEEPKAAAAGKSSRKS